MTERVASEDAAGHKASSSRFGKGRLNLLNPMSLLARRRVSQNQSRPEEVVSPPSLAVPAMPDDYDPRIRGNIVHDFSAPRARRIHSYQGQSAEISPISESRPFEGTGRRASDLPGLADGLAKRNVPLSQHSPIFTEHFNDDRQALQPANKGYLHSFVASSALRHDSGPINLPAFAKNLPAALPDKDEVKTHNRSPSSPDSQMTAAIPAPAVAFEEEEEEVASQDEVLPPIAHPTHPPPPPPVPQTSPPTPPVPQTPPPPPPVGPQTSPPKDHKREHLPKHMTSTSSRFSFQLGGVDSAAQERILEEKHKQQAALKRPMDEPEVVDEDVQDDDYDYDPDAEYDLEEKIPGVNADLEELDEDVEEISDVSIARSQRMARPEAFHFTPVSTMLSPTTTSATSLHTPRDEMGQVIGYASTTDSPKMGQPLPPDQADINGGDPLRAMLNGLGISSMQAPGLTGGVISVPLIRRQSENFDDDMYFDDGNFDDLGADDEAEDFDEAIFDDDISTQIPDIPAQNAKKLEAAQHRTYSSLQGTSSHDGIFPTRDCTTSPPLEGKQVSFAEPAIGVLHDQAVLHGELPSSDTGQPAPIQRGGLTEGNLAAYHDALVLAANEAAANGRFSRQTSTSQASEDQGSSSQMHESHPGLVSDDSRLDLDHLGVEEDETFPFDDDLDDDPMIAEANAEVLENDDEGFYGREFGFYARAHGKGNAEPVNGGYFGPHGVDGIKRSHSAKANFQEPSLTPITERSEWSTRNSVASLQIPIGPYSTQSMPSPGIAQLLDLDSATFDDEDMTLSALIKLRRGAWGGSSTSVNSMGGSHNGNSPLAPLGSRDFAGSSNYMGTGHKITSPVHSLTDSVGISEFQGEREDKEREVLTMTQNTPRKGSSEKQNSSTAHDQTVQSPASVASDKSQNNTHGHSRASSGAESISYVKDPDGSGRWVLERRRTGDDGELEIIGREYVAGARI